MRCYLRSRFLDGAMEIKDQIARTCRHYLDIRRRGKIKDPEIIGQLALQFIESDCLIEAIDAAIPRDEMNALSAWTLIKAEFYNQRDRGDFDLADFGRKLMRDSLYPILKRKAEDIKRGLIHDFESAIINEDKEKIMQEIEEADKSWRDLKKELKSND